MSQRQREDSAQSRKRVGASVTHESFTSSKRPVFFSFQNWWFVQNCGFTWTSNNCTSNRLLEIANRIYNLYTHTHLHKHPVKLVIHLPCTQKSRHFLCLSLPLQHYVINGFWNTLSISKPASIYNHQLLVLCSFYIIITFQGLFFHR